MTLSVDTEQPVIEQQYPPLWGSRTFRLSRQMLDQLLQDPIGRELYPLSAGSDSNSKHPRSRGPLQLPSMMIAYCVSGAGRLEYEGQRLPIAAGDLVLLDKDSKVNLVPLEQGWTYHFVLVDGTCAALYFSRLAGYSPLVSIGIQPTLIEEMKAFVALREESHRLDLFVRAGCRLKYFLATLFVEVASRGSEYLNDKLDQSRDVIKKSLSTQLQLEDLAKACGFSKSYYIRRFKERFAQSPIQYFLHLKMQKACDLLESTDYDIQDVAGFLGYKDAYYFSRIFKQTIGTAPQKYRQRFRGE
ncbi:MAG: AraC family transcriptional regulator [Spongiibacteraceae bacterium]